MVEQNTTQTLPDNWKQLLASAVESGDCSTVQDLVARGADINSTDGNGRSMLFLAELGGHARMIDLLGGLGARINGYGTTLGLALEKTFKGRFIDAMAVLAKYWVKEPAYATPGKHYKRATGFLVLAPLLAIPFYPLEGTYALTAAICAYLALSCICTFFKGVRKSKRGDKRVGGMCKKTAFLLLVLTLVIGSLFFQMEQGKAASLALCGLLAFLGCFHIVQARKLSR